MVNIGVSWLVRSRKSKSPLRCRERTAHRVSQSEKEGLASQMEPAGKKCAVMLYDGVPFPTGQKRFPSTGGVSTRGGLLTTGTDDSAALEG